VSAYRRWPISVSGTSVVKADSADERLVGGLLPGNVQGGFLAINITLEGNNITLEGNTTTTDTFETIYSIAEDSQAVPPAVGCRLQWNDHPHGAGWASPRYVADQGGGYGRAVAACSDCRAFRVRSLSDGAGRPPNTTVLLRG
jgi:hypothetical protein